MKILVCGGRRYGYLGERPFDPECVDEMRHVKSVLDALAVQHSKFYVADDNWLPLDFTIIEGGAKGADHCAVEWCMTNYAALAEYKADWGYTGPGAVLRKRGDGTTYDVTAGHRRNRRMLDEGKPNLVVAFPGGRGTADMIKAVRKENSDRADAPMLAGPVDWIELIDFNDWRPT